MHGRPSDAPPLNVDPSMRVEGKAGGVRVEPQEREEGLGRTRLVRDQLLVANAVDRQGKDVHEVFDQSIVLGPRHDQVLQSARPLESGAAKLVEEARDDLIAWIAVDHHNASVGEHGRDPRQDSLESECLVDDPVRVEARPIEHRGVIPRHPVELVRRGGLEALGPGTAGEMCDPRRGDDRIPSLADAGASWVAGDDLLEQRGAAPRKADDEHGAFVREVTPPHRLEVGGRRPFDDRIGPSAMACGVEGRVQQAIAERGGLEGGGGVAESVARPGEAEGDRDPDRRRDPPVLEDGRVAIAGAFVIAGRGVHLGDEPLRSKRAVLELDQGPDRRAGILDPTEPGLAPGAEEEGRRLRAWLHGGRESFDGLDGLVEPTREVAELGTIDEIGGRGASGRPDREVESTKGLGGVVLGRGDPRGESVDRFRQRIEGLERRHRIERGLQVARRQRRLGGLQGVRGVRRRCHVVESTWPWRAGPARPRFRSRDAGSGFGRTRPRSLPARLDARGSARPREGTGSAGRWHRCPHPCRSRAGSGRAATPGRAS